MKKRGLSPQQTILNEALFNPPAWLVACAKRLQDHMTPAETLLWSKLHYIPGWQAQTPLHRWIVDFYHVPTRLALEIDGGVHTETRVIRKDDRKDQSLWYKFGIRVVRIVNRRVLDDVQHVIFDIQQEVDRIQGVNLKRQR